MKLQEPIEIFIAKDKPIAFFKIEGNKYLIFNGVQTCHMGDGFDLDKYIILSGEEVIPFILVHNMRIDLTLDSFKKGGRGGKHHLFTIIKEAHIDNELNTNLTWENVYNEYNDGIITTDELYIWLMLEAQRKYK